MNTRFHLYLNREPLPETVKPGDVLKGVEITPFGDWPHGEVVQHVTPNAARLMVDAWRNGGSKKILVDFDHDAEEGKSTQAAAWIENLRLEANSLVGDFVFTDVGAEAVSSRRYRFLSPCWECRVDKWHGIGTDKSPAEVTPVRLVSVALTNKPNIPVAPLLNREPSATQPVEPKEQNMDKIKEALGLAPEATDDDVLAAIAAMKQANEEAAQAKAEAEKAAAEKEAEDFAAANERKCNREVVKAQYLANKEATIALVNAIPEPAKTTVVNKAEAKVPQIANRAADADEAVLKQYENMAAGKAKDDFLMANAITINRARNARASAQ